MTPSPPVDADPATGTRDGERPTTDQATPAAATPTLPEENGLDHLIRQERDRYARRH